MREAGTPHARSLSRLVVDDRWSGDHGIGRFSTEVLARLTTPWTSLRSRLSPSSPRDALASERLKLSAQTLVFSPSFNAGLTRATQLITVHDLIHLHGSDAAAVARRLYFARIVRPAIRRAGAVLTGSESARTELSDWLGDPRIEILTTGYGRSTAFSVSPAATQADPNSGRFVWVGNLRKHKNVPTMLAALALRPQYHLTAVIRDENLFMQAATVAGVADRVSVRSGLTDDELAALYRASVACIMPSTSEGFGLPALEALSCGKPVVYWSGCASVAEICAGSGFAATSPDDSEEWAHLLDAAVDSPKAPIDMGPEWSHTYEWDSVAERVNTTLSRMLAG